MSIASEINRIKSNIANAYTNCNLKGATMPDAQNSANLAETINSIASGSGNVKFKFGTFTIDNDTTDYRFTGLDFKPKLLIVDSGNMGVADVARSVHWQHDEFTGKKFVCSHKSTNASVTIAVSSNYCQVYDYGFYIKQYLTLPLLAGTYTYIALTDE